LGPLSVPQDPNLGRLSRHFAQALEIFEALKRSKNVRMQRGGGFSCGEGVKSENADLLSRLVKPQMAGKRTGAEEGWGGCRTALTTVASKKRSIAKVKRE
jgi:hypothetical protein